MGYNVFNRCENLTVINVDDANTSFSSVDGVLYNKNKTTIVKYPQGKKTDSTFIIPGSVTSIVGYAFYRCTSLTGISIPNGVTSIGEYAFYDCTGLRLTGISIPNGVTSIGEYAFHQCFYDGNANISITIPGSVTTIGSYAFAACRITVTLGNGIVRIERNAFEDIWNTSITIPASVTYIGRQAFAFAQNLISVTFSTGSAINTSNGNFGDYAFPEVGTSGGDTLWWAYRDYGAGTYTRPASQSNDKWTMQP